jgi:superfamily II DNA helicase RecQ
MNIDPYLDITIDAMSTALHHIPRGFQRDVIPYILRMKESSPYPIHPVLLVQGTGGGKSSVYQTIGIIKQGVSLIIENTLSLSSDQLSKITLISQHIPNVHCFQLDSLKSDTARSSLATQLSKLHSKSNTTIFLFSSPETLLKEPWASLISTLIRKDVLKQICVDEVHLFVMFAVTFRHSFLQL